MQFKNLSVIGVIFLVGCGPNIMSENADSFVSQLFLDMSSEAYQELKAQYYPPLPENTVIGYGCFGSDKENQQCVSFVAGEETAFSLSYTHEELVADCAIFTCYPRNLPDIVAYDLVSGVSENVADLIIGGFQNWGTWDGQKTVYIFVDPATQRLIGVMLEGDFEGVMIRFPQ